MLYITMQPYPEREFVSIPGQLAGKIAKISARTNRLKGDLVEMMLDYALDHLTIVEEVPEQ